MHTEGEFAPASVEAARERYERLGETARTVVREVARAMEFDAEEYDRRVTPEVVATARDALFAEALRVHVGRREEFEDWRAENPDLDLAEFGSPDVDRVAWHPAPVAGEVVATTFAEEEAAAVGTLRRQAFGRVYEPALRES